MRRTGLGLSGLFFLLCFTVSGEAGTAPSGSDAAHVAKDSARAILDLGVEGAGECGPPLLQVDRFKIWGSVFPEYRQKYGLAVTLGFLGLDHRDRRLVLGTAYNRREDRFYFYQSLAIPLGSPDCSAPELRQWLNHRDGGRGRGIGLRWPAPRDGHAEAWLTVALDFSHTDYNWLRSLSAHVWPPGRVAAVSGRIGFDLGRRLSGPIGALAGGFSLTQGARVLGGEHAFGQVRFKGVITLPHGLLWTSGGWSDGDVPAQYLFDLAAEGPILGRPLWLRRSRGYRAAGAEAHLRLYGVAHCVGFVTHATLASTGAGASELGLGLGLSHGTGHPAWKLRIDFPLFSRVAGDIGPAWDLRRFSIRIWLWPGLTRMPGSPHSDFRYVRN